MKFSRLTKNHHSLQTTMLVFNSLVSLCIPFGTYLQPQSILEFLTQISSIVMRYLKNLPNSMNLVTYCSTIILPCTRPAKSLGFYWITMTRKYQLSDLFLNIFQIMVSMDPSFLISNYLDIDKLGMIHMYIPIIQCMDC